MISFTKNELLCIQQCICQHESEVRKQQLVLIDCKNFIEGDFAPLDLYYNKQLVLLQQNKEKVAQMIAHIVEQEKTLQRMDMKVIARVSYELD